ncbi:hypothetical protein A9267_19980 [Shewanella sp. UCD-FRSSP16_17]|uniref:cytochrome c-type biogenesis protein n=1 Tax=Shewanella TaxID=22 RepID=UPI0006D68B9C|nr:MULTISPECIES: cytochrome c-type biogenesis protein CcmH [Shewanella]KPZ69232.1 Cytochrome c-type biogenesis protein CcmH precursor [Shewanella sp. P1-14-1]OBT10011.1 hypothetical protein A9267_19980 [Shewanella sp. UCD-FRSSP16_17]
MIKLLMFTLMLFSAASIAAEQITPEHFQSNSQAEIKTTAFDIAKSLRCPVSANQSLFESQTKIAHELKGEIFLQLQQGKTKQQIIDFMVNRYGEKIHYMPIFSWATAGLFLLPLLLVLFMMAWFIRLNQTSRHSLHYQNMESTNE